MDTIFMQIMNLFLEILKITMILMIKLEVMYITII